MNIKRTTKTRIAVLAAVAAGAFASAPGAASAEGATIRSGVSVYMQYQPSGNGVGQGFLFGSVNADNKNCKNVTIHFGRQHNMDPNTWDYVWNYRNVTKADPTYAIYLSSADEQNYQYAAWTGRQVIRKNGNKIICDYGNTQDLVYTK